MHTRLAVFALLLLAAARAGHAGAAESVPLHWDCTRAGTPSLRETAATYGYDNYARAVPLREALYRQIRRACAQGAQRVVVVEPDAARRVRSRLAAR